MNNKQINVLNIPTPLSISPIEILNADTSYTNSIDVPITCSSRWKCSSALVNVALAGVLGLGLSFVGIASTTNHAYAQAVPAGCTPSPATDNGTVTCVSTSTIGPITTTVEDLTVIVGSAGTPTAVENLAGDAINMSSDGSLTLNIYNAGSTVSGSDNGVEVGIVSGTRDIIVTSEGAISGNNNGVFSVHEGTGSITLGLASVTGDADGNANGTGVFAKLQNITSTGVISISATGVVSGGRNGVTAQNQGTGGITMSLASVTGNAASGSLGHGVYAFIENTAATGDVSITASGAISGAEDGVKVINEGTGGITLNVASVSGDAEDNGTGDGVNVRANNTAATGDISITATGAISGGGDGVEALNEGLGGNVMNLTTVTGGFRGVFSLIQNIAATGDLSVTATGAISGVADGVHASNYGTGDITLNLASVTGDTDGNGSGNGVVARLRTAANSGDISITTTGTVSGSVYGIQVRNDGLGTSSITASGAVTGSTGIGIYDRDNNAATTITTTSSITGTGGTAIDFQGDGHDTLNLNAGSSIVGLIDFGNGNDGLGGTNANDVDTLNVAAGVSGEFNFTDLASAPENINVAGGSVLINSGTKLVTVDASGFATPGVAVSDLSSSILNMLDSNLGATPEQPSSTPTSQAYGGETPFKYFWSAGFGGASEVQGSGNVTDTTSRFGGFAAGGEAGDLLNGIYGVFGGYAKANVNTQLSSSETSVDNVFGGVYYKREFNNFSINAALTTGNASHKTGRIVGASTANSEYSGWFYTPSLTVNVPINTLPMPAVFSGRVNYTGLHLGGYTETGVGSPLTVNSRNIGVLGARGQINFPMSKTLESEAIVLFNVSLGIDSQTFTSDGTVNASVADGTGVASFNFAASNGNRVSGLAGVDFSLTSKDLSKTFGFSGELQSDFGGNVSAVGKIIATLRF